MLKVNNSSGFASGGIKGKKIYTASGAINEGDPVVDNGDNTVSVVSATVSGSNTTAAQSYSDTNVSTPYLPMIEQLPNNSFIWKFGAGGANNTGVAGCTSSGTTLSTTFVTRSRIDYSGCVVVDKTLGKFAINGDGGTYQYIDSGSISSRTITWSTQLEYGYLSNATHIAMNHNSDVFLLTYTYSSGYGLVSFKLNSGTTEASELDRSISSGDGYSRVFADIGSTNFIGYWDSDTSYHIINVTSAGVITKNVTAYNASLYPPRKLSYDVDNNLMVMFATSSLSGSNIYGKTVTVGSGITFGTSHTLQTTNLPNNSNISSCYDEYAKCHVVAWYDPTHVYYMVVKHINGVLTKLYTTTLYTTTDIIAGVDVCFDSNQNQVVLVFQRVTTTDSFYCHYSLIDTLSVDSTNVNTLVGLSDKTVSDAQSVTVTIDDGINDKQTDLTPSTIYYVEYDSNLTASPNTNYTYKQIGTAVSSTHMQVEVI